MKSFRIWLKQAWMLCRPHANNLRASLVDVLRVVGWVSLVLVDCLLAGLALVCVSLLTRRRPTAILQELKSEVVLAVHESLPTLSGPATTTTADGALETGGRRGRGTKKKEEAAQTAAT